MKGLRVRVEQDKPMRLGVQLQCEPSQLLAVVGASGSGKTSLLRVVAGVMKPAMGLVQIDDEVWFSAGDAARPEICLTPQQRRVGMVFQNYALMPHMSALENVCLGNGSQNLAKELLAAVGLQEHLHSRPAQLSGGQQQRVGLARALARQPKLLLLDEPFSAVDQLTRIELYALLADMRKRLSMPIVLVTHDLNEARLLADEIVVLDQGASLQQGRPEQIHRAPRNARVASLVGIQNRFEGVFLQDGLRWGHSDANPLLQVRDKGRIAPGSLVSWIVPGEGLQLRAHSQGSGDSTFAGVLEKILVLGEIAHLDVRLPFDQPQTVRVSMSLAQVKQANFAMGQAVSLELDTALIHVMPLKAHS